MLGKLPMTMFLGPVNIKNNREGSAGLTILLAVLSFSKLLIHLGTNAFVSYGIFRDELYYIACSNKLALGYVDHPPLSIYLLSVSRRIFGDSLFAIRLFPAIAAAITVLITGLLVRRIGGKKPAIILAALAVMLAPIQLGMNTVYSMNGYDILIWALLAYVVILVIEENKPKWWIVLGILLGLGLLNKIGILWFGFGFFIALLITKLRSYLLTKWPWIAGAIAALLFSPFIFWNFLHDFAHLEFIRNARMFKYAGVGVKDFVLGQILLQNPVALPLWLGGLYFFFFHKEGKRFRILGIIYAVTFLILLISGESKAEYLSPAYPMLFAGGAVLFEKLFSRKYWRWLKFAFPAVIAISGILLAPLALPVLPVKKFIEYSSFIGIGPSTSEDKELAQLPQFYADMFGWENMAAKVAGVYHSLAADEKPKTTIFAGNYGEAGAIEYYKKKYDLPTVISSHNNYWLWGYGDDAAEVYIFLGGEREDYQEYFLQVEQAAVITCDYCMPYENNLPVYVCKNKTTNISELWKSIKHYE
jgi:hypothetical protein